MSIAREFNIISTYQYAILTAAGIEIVLSGESECALCVRRSVGITLTSTGVSLKRIFIAIYCPLCSLNQQGPYFSAFSPALQNLEDFTKMAEYSNSARIHRVAFLATSICTRSNFVFGYRCMFSPVGIGPSCVACSLTVVPEISTAQFCMYAKTSSISVFTLS